MAEKEYNSKSSSLIKADEETQRRRDNYFHPIKGAWDRWKSSLENNTNPVKAVLDHGLGSFIPGLNIGQAIYSAVQSYNNLTSDNGVKKTEELIKEKDPKAILSLIGTLWIYRELLVQSLLLIIQQNEPERLCIYT